MCAAITDYVPVHGIVLLHLHGLHLLLDGVHVCSRVARTSSHNRPELTDQLQLWTQSLYHLLSSHIAGNTCPGAQVARWQVGQALCNV